MKTTFLFLFVLFAIGGNSQSGFSSVNPITPLNISFSTADVSQSKTWTYAGKQWAVLTSETGTNIYRLDGSTWVNTFTLASGATAKADVKVVGDVAHIFTWKGTSSYLYSVQYDVATSKYKLWSVRNTRVAVTLDAGVSTATIDIDASGRMWLASNGNRSVYVRYADAPYSKFSTATTLATGLVSTDIGAVIAMPALHKVGVFWSNKTTKRFGFRTHNDADLPATWSADEIPAAQSALNIGGGFAENQFNLKSLANGTLFSVVKTAYNMAGYPQISLLHRRPDGSWDIAYPVTINEGTNPVIAVNETLGKINVFYTLASGINYKETSASSIMFSEAQPIINGAYDNASTSKSGYDSSLILIASNSTTAVGVVATDNTTPAVDTVSPVVTAINRQVPLVLTTNAKSLTLRVVFNEPVLHADASDFTLTTTGNVTGVLNSNAVTEVAASNSTAFDVVVSSVAGNGTLRLDLKSSATGITDLAGNLIKTGFNAGQVYNIMQLPPQLTTVTLYSENLQPALAKPGDIIHLDFTASEPVNLPAVTIASTVVTVVPGSTANSFKASYTLTEANATGNVPFTINFSTPVGTPGAMVSSTTDGSAVTFDKTVPQVQSIRRYLPADSITNALSVTYAVSFSEAVKFADAADFTITVFSGNITASIASNAVVSRSADGNIYDVTVSGITGTGVFRLDLKSSGTGITDAAYNNITTGFTSGETYTITNAATGVKPTLTSVSFTSGNTNHALAKPGDLISLVFVASGPLSNVAVIIAAHQITPVAGGGNSFTAIYTVTENDVNGIVPFTINFSNASGLAGDAVTTTTTGAVVTIDKTLPVVLSVNRQAPAEQTTSASSLTWRVLFSEPVAGVDASDFTVAVVSGAVSGSIGSATAVGADGTTYDVVVNAVSGNGIVQLNINQTNTGIADAAGNLLASGFATGETFTVQPVIIPGGFTSVTPLQPLDLSQPTKDKPQAKAWYYANKWWCVLSVAAGTKLFRLDGTTWTDILLVNNKTSKPDCRIDGDLVHVLCYKGALNNSLLYTLQYDPVTNTYKPWINRPGGTTLVFPSGSETATIAVDGNGRLWAASDGTTDILVWYSDAPYTTWSAPYTIALNTKTDDICAITYMPALKKIGVFWSNQVTKKLGFRTHADGTDPTIWTNDETPASQSAINIGNGMADDHMNLKVAADGTLYCATKTSYNKNGYAKLILLVRRPNGVWDNQYIVTMNPEGTQPIVLLNEQKHKIRMVYASLENGGDLMYRESDMANISFGPARTLLSNPGVLYDYPTGSHQNFNDETLVLATEVNATPQKAVGFILRDETAVALDENRSIAPDKKEAELNTSLAVFPNPFSSSATVSFNVAVTGNYTLSLFDVKGAKQSVISSGWAKAGVTNTFTIKGDRLTPGIYYVNLRTTTENKIVKVLVAR